MSIVVNTNVSSLLIQSNLAKAGDAENTAMLRMSTGLKINSAADDAAGLAVATNLTTTIRGDKVASQNIQTGASLLTTAEGTLKEIQSNLARIRDLAVQAANGTNDTKATTAIKTEIKQRATEINRLSGVANFNGISLFDSSSGKAGATGIALQVGANSNASGNTDNTITLDSTIFKNATVSAMQLLATSSSVSISQAVDTAFTDATSINTFIASCDTAISNVTDRNTLIGAFQNRLKSAATGVSVQSTNLTAARSGIQDADIAEESSNYVQANILKQASASLLTQANQAPSMAINLI